MHIEIITYRVYCHKCKYGISLASQSVAQLKRLLRELHWTDIGEDNMLCPKCSQETKFDQNTKYGDPSDKTLRDFQAYYREYTKLTDQIRKKTDEI